MGAPIMEIGLSTVYKPDTISPVVESVFRYTILMMVGYVY